MAHTERVVVDRVEEPAQGFVVDTRDTEEEVEFTVDLRGDAQREFTIEAVPFGRVTKLLDDVLDVVVIQVLAD